MRLIEVTLGIPKLGMVKEIYDLDNSNDCQAWDMNTANGCITININPIKGNKMNVETNSPETEVLESTYKVDDNGDVTVDSLVSIDPEAEIVKQAKEDFDGVSA